ncbi:MAG: LysR substrate-binding domain-containing protein, partial [Rikenellaceae bacterium]
MTIVQLEYLISVAKYGSFSTAATYCYVTQPSLSTQIKNLEDELGVVLLNRNSKPLILTEAGRMVVDKAKDVISGFYNITEIVKGLRNEVSGALRIAAIPTIAPYLLHRFIPEFVKVYPNLNLQVKEMFTRDIITAIGNDTIDVAILAAGFLDDTDIKEEVLFDDPFYFYAAQDNNMLKQKEVSVIDLDVNSLLLLADGHCLRTQILDLCHAHNPLGKNLYLEGGSLETIIRMVDKTGGATIL